jgi:Zn-dependent protease
MTEAPSTPAENPAFQQSDFERITQTVSAEFQIDESLMENGIPTYYLKQPQETKQAFLKLLKSLEPMKLIALLRRIDKRIVLKVIPKPQVKPSNIMVNWLLLFATIATTFVTGYMLSLGVTDPIFGGATFTLAMLAVLGTHEMGHKITANKKGMEATPPYFIPGPPPFGTFGAVIMQKSLAPNKDSLFDVGADGPIAGFIVSTIVSIIGLAMLVPSPPVESTPISEPFLWTIIGRLLNGFNMMPNPPPGGILLLQPFAFAGWVGLFVTMLNLLPAAMLDGGHVTRSIFGDKPRIVLTALSVIYLIILNSYLMAILVVFMSMYRHPGPLDDVSGLSTRRKLLAVLLIVVFVLCSFPSLSLF